MKIYPDHYFKTIWKIVWRITRQHKGKSDKFFYSSVRPKFLAKMYIIAHKLYLANKFNLKTPDFSKIHLKFEI